MASIQGVYIALFGRPADPLGLAFFNEATDNGANLNAIGDLAATEEYQSRFEGMNNVQIVSAIYQQLFNRDPDLAGLTYFVNELNSGRQNINTIAINIYDGAQGNDAAILENKEEAANRFTAALDTGSEVAAYQGNAAADRGREFLAGVDATEESIPDEDEIDDFISDLEEDPDGDVEGEIFTLTPPGVGVNDGVDNFTGTNDDDIFRAITDGALSADDVIRGEGGTDALRISESALTTTDDVGAPVVTGVEEIYLLDVDGFTMDMSAVDGATNFFISGGAAGTVELTEAQAGLQFDVRDITGDKVLDVNFEGAVSTLQVSVDNLDGSLLTIVSDDEIEALNIMADGDDDDATVDEIDATDLEEVEAVSITGEGNLDLDISLSTEVSSVDAGAATGDISVDASGSEEDIVFTGGVGENVFEGGLGDDTFDGGLNADTYTGNGGDDTFIIETSTINNGGFDTVTDFVTDEDFLSFGGDEGDGDNYAESAIVAADYDEARGLAENEFSTEDGLSYVAVEEATGVYVFFDGNGDGDLNSNGTDHAVFLAGITLADIEANDII